MRRLLRWLLNGLTVLSLLLCVAVVAMWVRSRSNDDGCDAYRVRGGKETEINVMSNSGQLSLTVSGPAVEGVFWGPTRGRPTIHYYHFGSSAIQLEEDMYDRYSSSDAVHHFGWGFRWFHASGCGARLGGVNAAVPLPPVWSVAVPHWLIVLLTALVPALRLRKAVARRPRREGYCPVCGYDLRATPGCCPECGTAVPAKASA